MALVYWLEISHIRFGGTCFEHANKQKETDRQGNSGQKPLWAPSQTGENHAAGSLLD
jgi:hypothetical protein